jgi:hypothetical protein
VVYLRAFPRGPEEQASDPHSETPRPYRGHSCFARGYSLIGGTCAVKHSRPPLALRWNLFNPAVLTVHATIQENGACTQHTFTTIQHQYELRFTSPPGTNKR